MGAEERIGPKGMRRALVLNKKDCSMFVSLWEGFGREEKLVIQKRENFWINGLE